MHIVRLLSIRKVFRPQGSLELLSQDLSKALDPSCKYSRLRGLCPTEMNAYTSYPRNI